MKKLGVRLVASFLITFLSVVYAQEMPDRGKTESEKDQTDILARQSTVFEQFHTTVTFEKDGRWEEEEYCRARVESEGGVNQMGRLVFGYAAENQRVEVLLARALKEDGTVVEAGPDSILEVTEPFAGLGSQYTDYRQKHVLIPGLRPGDVVEYRFRRVEERPFAPGHFWFAHSFQAHQTCLEERLTISIPDSSDIRLRHKPKFVPALKDEGGRRIYSWESSHLPDDESKTKDKKREQKSRKELREQAQPDVQLTTFASWEQLGSWYKPLQESRMHSTEELRRKTEELTRDCKTDVEKIRAIYSFVATGVRYVSLSFGLGRYIPHPAEQVLELRYGDCKDKHTLLATMLRIAGFQACPALTNAWREVTEDQPSPIQFNHVLTVVHLADSEIWLDATPETAPFQVLSSTLRKKPALVVHLDGPSALTKIPGIPPFAFYEETLVEATLSETGFMTGKVSYRVRGDDEIGWRSGFRARPASDWKTAVEASHRRLQLPGEVSRVTAVSDPLRTDEAFEVKYEFSGLLDVTRKGGKQSTLELPFPRLQPPWAAVSTLPDPEPLDLGYPIRKIALLRLKIPDGFIQRLPLPVSVKRDYGEYQSKYEIHGDTLVAERRIEIHLPEIDGKRGPEHLSFARAVDADSAQSLSPTEESLKRRLNAEKEDAGPLHASAMRAFDSRDYATALSLLKKVVNLEPEDRYAWNNLGRCYSRLGQLEAAVDAYLKQISINPYDEYSYNNLGLAYSKMGRYPEAEEAFRKQLEISPLDRYAHKNLGRLYYEQEQYEKAHPQIEKALTITPEDISLRLDLGSILFHLGRLDEGFQNFSKVLQSSQGPTLWNNVAYTLAQFRFRMDLAEQYAEAGVNGTRTSLLSMPVSGEFCCPQISDALASHWDTLGFVYMQKGEWDKAEKHIKAAWELAQHGESGLHLAQVYLHRGDKDQAVKQLARSLAAFRPPNEVREKLTALVGAHRVETLTATAAQELVEMRTVRVSPGQKEDLHADFYLVLSANLPSDVKFIEGDERLREYEAHLKKVRFPFAAVDNQPVRLIRRGELVCSAKTGACKFILRLPRDVHSLQPTPVEEKLLSQKKK